MRHINVVELNELMETTVGKPLLLDVREPWEFAICHLEESTLIPMRQIPEAMDKLDPEQQTVVICHTGMRSQQVCIYLEHAGFTNVWNLTGGVHAWAVQIDRRMATY